MKYFAFSFSLLFFLRVLAEPSVIQEFRAAALSALQKAEARGLQEVEGIPFKKIIDVIDRVPIVYDPHIRVQQTNRKCAYWQPAYDNVRMIGSGKTLSTPAHIRLNEDCVSLGKAELEALSVHEILGVGFSADRNYEASVQILNPNTRPEPLSEQQLLWRQNRLKMDSGGSTGVGGGGDYADIRFKLEGLKMLENMSGPGRKLFGLPYEVLREAILHMRVSPAADIDTIIEFRSYNFEQHGPIAYIHSSLYRAKDPQPLGLLCLYSARLFAYLTPMAIGFTNTLYESPFDTPEEVDPVTREAMIFQSQHIRIR